MGQFLIALILIASAPASAQPKPTEETTRQFLTWCDANLDECRAFLNEFIIGGIKLANTPAEIKCIPLERNKAANKMLGLMRDPELADWDIGNGLMQSMTDAFPCLTDH